MVLFTKVYGELSLRIQQSLRRCNNRGAFQAHAGAPERQVAQLRDGAASSQKLRASNLVARSTVV